MRGSVDPSIFLTIFDRDVGDPFQVLELFNPLHFNTKMHILQTVLYTFPMVLTRRIELAIKG